MADAASVWSTLDDPDLDDPLDANAWAHRALAASMAEVVAELRVIEREIADGKLSMFGGDADMERLERARLARRAEMREISVAMRGLIPQARLRDAEDAVRGEAKAMHEPDRGPVTDAAYLDRADCRPAAKRGRPRKRSLL